MSRNGLTDTETDLVLEVAPTEVGHLKMFDPCVYMLQETKLSRVG